MPSIIYMRTVVIWLQMTFMYPTANRWRRVLTIVVQWLFRFALYNTFVSCLLRVCLEAAEPVSFLNLAIYGSSIITTHFLQNNGVALKAIIERMHRTFTYETKEGVDENHTMANYVKMTDTFCKSWIGLITISAQIMIIYPVFYNNENNRRDFAIPIWYPFDMERTPIYEILLTLQCVGHFVVTCAYGAADSLLISILVLTAKQYEILGSNIENIFVNSLLGYKVTMADIDQFLDHFDSVACRNDRIQKIIESKAYLAEINADFRENLRQHQRLIRLCRQIENTLWPLVFLKVTVSAWYHIMIFLLIVMSNDVTIIILFGQYEMLAMFELFVICAAGNHLLMKGDAFRIQITRCPWYLFDQTFRTNYCMLTMGSLRDVGISVGKMAQLSLAAFLSIMKTSFSYFAVLRQVVQQKE